MSCIGGLHYLQYDCRVLCFPLPQLSFKWIRSLKVVISGCRQFINTCSRMVVDRYFYLHVSENKFANE